MPKEKIFESYLATASSLIQQYNGAIPLNEFLKQYFSQHKKFGSRDRKHITELCYCNYRTGHALKKGTIKEILESLFLCSQKQNELLVQLKPDWNEKAELRLEEKISFLSSPFNIKHIFPWKDELSTGIDVAAFAASHLVRPDLFLRIRPGNKEPVLKKLEENRIEYEECAEDCLRLPNTTKIENVLEINKEVVIQDYSSQRIKEFLESTKSEIRVWDCCAASGGKSILAVDVFKNIDLTVSDVRPFVINNLKQRFKEAGIKNYHSFIADLANSKFQTPNFKFDLIICDAPCTGSGTWSRTPEQLYFFDKEKINYYSKLQKKIASNTIHHLAKNGFFLYITCSVFKKENEEVVKFIQQNFKLQLVKEEVLIGYNEKADTMFAALLKKADNP